MPMRWRMTAQFIALGGRSITRDIQLGDIEPYPYLSFVKLIAWIDALQARLETRYNVRGLDFFRLM